MRNVVERTATTTHPTSRRPALFSFVSLCLILLALNPAIASKPEVEEPDPLELWNDPTFQKQFTASYGFNAEIEPRVTVVEREQMEKIRPHLSGDIDLAIKQLEKVTKPESSAVFDFTLGNVYFQQGEEEVAAGHYETAIGKFPSFRRAYKNLGLIRVRQGRLEQAITALSRVIELGGADGTTLGLLGFSYSSTGQFTSAESAYREAVLMQPDLLDWRLGLTHSVYKQRKFAEAIVMTEELIGRFPDNPDFWLMQANAYIGAGEPMKAAYNFEIVQRMGKASLASLYTLGDIYVNEGVWSLAARAYGLAVAADLEQPLQRSLAAVEVLAQRGALPQSKQLLETVQSTLGEKISDEERVRLLRLEARLAVADDRSDEAVTVLEEIVALDPLDGQALIMLGQHYVATEEPERAIFFFERAQSLEEFEADASVRHAQVLVSQSHYEDAVQMLERAQKLDPRDDVGRYLDQVKRIARASR